MIVQVEVTISLIFVKAIATLPQEATEKTDVKALKEFSSLAASCNNISCLMLASDLSPLRNKKKQKAIAVADLKQHTMNASMRCKLSSLLNFLLNKCFCFGVGDVQSVKGTA